MTFSVCPWQQTVTMQCSLVYYGKLFLLCDCKPHFRRHSEAKKPLIDPGPLLWIIFIQLRIHEPVLSSVENHHYNNDSNHNQTNTNDKSYNQSYIRVTFLVFYCVLVLGQWRVLWATIIRRGIHVIISSHRARFRDSVRLSCLGTKSIKQTF